MQSLQLTTDYFRGAVSVEAVADGLCPFRLRTADRDLLHPDLVIRASMPSGVRLELITDTTNLAVDLTWLGEPDPGEKNFIDLVVNGTIIASHPVRQGRQTVQFESVPAHGKRVQLWLSQFGPVVIHGIQIDDGATAEPAPQPVTRRWVTYGSSITHCRTAASPARTWPAVAARASGVHLTNLGFGGQCQFDPLVGRTIAQLPADFISMKLGINTHGAPSFSQRTWQQAIIGLVLSIRDHQPHVPLLIVSPIFSPDRETKAPVTGWTLVQMREQLSDLVDKFRQRGDANIHYLNGLQLLGPDDAHLLPDQLHPNATGYELIGERFAKLVFGPGGPFAG